MMSSGSQQSARFAAAESVKPVQDTPIRAVSPGSKARFHQPPTAVASGQGRAAAASDNASRMTGSTARPRHDAHLRLISVPPPTHGRDVGMSPVAASYRFDHPVRD